ncbi:7-deoxyloganetic acid glucosyltransferase-like [Magnolia sinica]|uniref:7-deoxyloganetic acid glucosyltransferase-like n=1 Tax=Magnolia sinica TaxID=86752 RepID=UPI00265AABD0|nr:7-deoxyloganetic acid glucosyltransferase-like [Magnolia sinica]
MEQPHQKKVPHVLIFPLPAQGHINSMLKLAQLLCLAEFHVTFLNSHHNHDRLLKCTDLGSEVAHWPGFRFATISDGLPPEHPRSADFLIDCIDSLKANTKPLFREMLISYCRSDDPITCIIADGIMTFTIDVADELAIPIIAFRTISACSFWSYFCIPKLIQAGELPFKDDADMEHAITCVPGMENVLRRCDLPSFCRAKQLTDPFLQIVQSETLNSVRASALILNTFEDLEGPTLSQIRAHFPTTYTIGPLHSLLKTRLTDSTESTHKDSSSSSLWKEDRTCITWLDSQPSDSVLYVSFGSFAVVTRFELLEFWHGLVNSQTRFLWVIRPDLVNGKGDMGHIPSELLEATNERGCLVEWAPQQEVLTHHAVGGFLTHSGWNSTLESVFAGVPMICWPFFADQQINSRFVGHVWRVGLDMKDRCDRRTVEMLVREMMYENVELRKRAAKMADLAKKCVSRGGSSYMNMERLIEDIRGMSL